MIRSIVQENKKLLYFPALLTAAIHIEKGHRKKMLEMP